MSLWLWGGHSRPHAACARRRRVRPGVRPEVAAPLLALILVSAAAAQPNRLTPGERAAGWQLLFDGSTSRGWTEVTGLPFPTTSWTIEDGCLKALPNKDGMQDLRTVETYRNFDFKFEWKISKAGNSGVKYLVQKTDRWQRRGESGFQARARGLEYQITDDTANPDALSGPTRRSAALYSVYAPSNTKLAEAGIFHQSEIVVRDGRTQHWLDGEKVLDSSLDDAKVVEDLRHLAKGGPLQRESFISLQNHVSEVWFRNLRIRRLE
jgi:hypothetical protein